LRAGESVTVLRVGIVQLTSTDELEVNLKTARELVGDAASQGAEWVALPENFAFMRREGLPVHAAAQPIGGSITEALGEMAREHGIWLLGGTFAEAIPEDQRVFNTSLLLDPAGEIAACYRKMHLFDVDLSESGGGVFRESDTFRPGETVAVADAPFGGIGLSVCYDLRFPELYREMSLRGADFLCVPSAFAPETGKDHWEVLLRARAIENQAFVIAPAQCGRHSPDRASYGRSMVVDPWGLILAQAADKPCAVVVDCDLDELERVRGAVPALSHRRL
jgi:predicted amidohydrolase